MVLNDAEVYYSLDDADLTSGNPDDLSGNGRDGTSINTPTTGATGKINEGFDFVKANSERVDSGYDLPNSDYTVIGWANVDSRAADYGYWGNAIASGSDGVVFLEDVSANNINCQVYSSGGLRHLVNTSTPGVIGTYVHYAITMTAGGVLTVYKNASSIGTDTDTPNTVRDINLSFANFYNSVYMDGKLDEVGAYSRVLSGTEISDSYNGGDGVNPYAAAATPKTMGVASPSKVMGVSAPSKVIGVAA